MPDRRFRRHGPDLHDPPVSWRKRHKSEQSLLNLAGKLMSLMLDPRTTALVLIDLQPVTRGD
jgi:hypothetical protein